MKKQTFRLSLAMFFLSAIETVRDWICDGQKIVKSRSLGRYKKWLKVHWRRQSRFPIRETKDVVWFVNENQKKLDRQALKLSRVMKKVWSTLEEAWNLITRINVQLSVERDSSDWWRKRLLSSRTWVKSFCFEHSCFGGTQKFQNKRRKNFQDFQGENEKIVKKNYQDCTEGI